MALQSGFLFALLSFTQLCEPKEPASDLLTCDSDYWLNIRCFLDSSAIPNRTENITYKLEFDVEYTRKATCTLLVEKDGYGCVFTAKLAFHPAFTDYHQFKISLCKNKQCVLLKSGYKPAHHIKPITPYNLTVQYENGNYTFSWISGYEDHIYRMALPFQYILRYHPVGQSTMFIIAPFPATVFLQKELHTNEAVYRISEAHFLPETEYIATVYNTIIHTAKYRGTRSDGCNEIRWKTLQAETTVGETNVGEIVVPVCMAVGLLSLLLFPAARLHIKRVAWLKTPNPSIPQLNQTAQGNFQFWLSKGHVQHIYSEEFSTIDLMTEIAVQRPLQQHTHDIYAQSHTPYVGPLMDIWTPCLKPDSCVTNSPTDCDVDTTLFCLSLSEPVEGLVSLDDLEPSLEVCKPSDNLIITPNPACLAQNYCTLTNTAVGLIPTFCQVKCSPNLDLGLNGQTSPDTLNILIEEHTPELDTVTLDNMPLTMEE